MHIPDGYLSPSTCAGLYAVSAPFWYTALKRVRQTLAARAVPLLSVFSAFSFVVMMFNLPLPGGTTGHAVGMGMAAIVLGPWVAILAVSTALLIQALLFGDGGITAFGANSFNMAIVGSIVAYAVYRIVACHASLTSSRRMLAAGLAGYCGINMAALCAAIEFGIQPRFFHDAAGTPLYAPYPLHIAVPAMMLGHLTFAGLAEMILSAGLVSYLQRADPDLLRTTAHDAPDIDDPRINRLPSSAPATRFHWPSARKLWVALAAFLILTPLGIVAAGTAWGEWRAADFADSSARQNIAAASRNQTPPTRAPIGLARLSSLWIAPFSNYAPPFIRNPKFAYLISAAVGVGVIILFTSLMTWLAARALPQTRIRPSFLEKTIDHLIRLSENATAADTVAHLPGFLQSLDPRVKLLGLGALLLSAIAVHRLWLSAALFLFSAFLAGSARLPLRTLVLRVWLAVLLFTGTLALPALFLTAGPALAHLPLLGSTITRTGLSAAAFLLLRAQTAATLVFTLISTTPWNRLLRALRLLHVPATLVVIIQMTYRYIFVFLHSAHDLFESRRVRLLGPLAPADGRLVAAAIAGVLLDKSLTLGSEVHAAMEARAFRGNVRLLDDLALTRSDSAQLALVLSFAALVIWFGR